MTTNPSTATEATHAHPYSAAVDILLAHFPELDPPKHAYRGNHAEVYNFAAEEAAHAVWCIEATPLVPWPRHMRRAA